MTRDLADTVKGLTEKAARSIMGKGSPWPKYEQEMTETIAAVFEPAICDLIVQAYERCAAYHELYGDGDIPAGKSIFRDWSAEIRARGGKA